MSLDGVVEGPGPGDNFELAGWSAPYFTPEIGRFIAESSAASDALLLGRVTYEGFAAAFASSTDGNPAAEMMNNIPKYVVSRTLEKAEWRNSTLLKGDAAEEVARLKRQPGKNINVSGSIELLQTLLRHGLVDELGLLVHPVVVGRGKRLFGDGFNTALDLMRTQTFSSGVVLLAYRPAAGEPG
jgi:dihydrofolate reductase